MIFETEDTEKLLVTLLDCYNAEKKPAKYLLYALDDTDRIALLESLIRENFGFEKLESWIEEVSGYDLLDHPSPLDFDVRKGVYM